MEQNGAPVAVVNFNAPVASGDGTSVSQHNPAACTTPFTPTSLGQYDLLLVYADFDIVTDHFGALPIPSPPLFAPISHTLLTNSTP